MKRNVTIDEGLGSAAGKTDILVTVDVDGRRLVFDANDLESISFANGV